METINTPGGAFISEGPLTTTVTATAAPDLLLSDIDERITKVKPMATPVDQITRHFASRPASSMDVAYYRIESKPDTSSLADDVVEAQKQGGQVFLNIIPAEPEIFDPTETVLLPDVKGRDGAPLVLYVVSRSADRETLRCIAVNAPDDNGFPAIPAGTALVRMGRAAAELDVQTAQFESLPVKDSNFCQIFKMQVEQSTLQKIAEKEVNWTFSDQEEVAVADMRLGMERSFLFGVKALINDVDKRQEVRLTGGIWNQAGATFEYNPAAMDEGVLVKLCAAAFASSAGSGRKFLFAGTGFIDALSRIPTTKVRLAAETVTRFGLQFHELVSNYGTLCLIYSPVFDKCGHRDDAFIVDPDLVTKYCHIPFRTDALDLRLSGVRNTDAVVITEASCVVLRQPAAHVRVVANHKLPVDPDSPIVKTDAPASPASGSDSTSGTDSNTAPGSDSCTSTSGTDSGPSGTAS